MKWFIGMLVVLFWLVCFVADSFGLTLLLALVWLVGLSRFVIQCSYFSLKRAKRWLVALVVVGVALHVSFDVRYVVFSDWSYLRAVSFVVVAFTSCVQAFRMWMGQMRQQAYLYLYTTVVSSGISIPAWLSLP